MPSDNLYEIHAYIPHYYKVVVTAFSEDEAIALANKDDSFHMLAWQLDYDDMGNYTGEPTVYHVVPPTGLSFDVEIVGSTIKKLR